MEQLSAESETIYRCGKEWFGWVRGRIQSLCNRCHFHKCVSEAHRRLSDLSFDDEQGLLAQYDETFQDGGPGLVRINLNSPPQRLRASQRE
jgi:hypothetical protein